MRTPYDADGLAAALRALPAWSGTTDRISRTVLADAPTTARVRSEVAEAADALDHHPVVEDVDGGTRFVLWTHSRGAVTELDTALAASIDAVVDGL